MKTAFLLVGLLTTLSAHAGQADFPKIDAGVQTARDSERRTILEAELIEEEKALVGAENALAVAGEGDKVRLQASVQRHEKNIAALNRELGRGAGSVGDVPVRLKAASAATATAAIPDKDAPYWDVYKREQTWRAK